MPEREILQDVLVSQRYRAQLLRGYRELHEWAVEQHRPGPYESMNAKKAINDLLVDYPKGQHCNTGD